MQNSNITNYINKANIINIKSEILCREAEDDFFYFNKTNSAYKKLDEAVKLSPFHTKSIVLLADICFIKGQFKKALNLYERAEKLHKNAKVLGAIASCNNVLNNLDMALDYCNRAINLITVDENSLFIQLTELKISILLKMKKYKLAYLTFIKLQNFAEFNTTDINYKKLVEKINIQKKLKLSHLKIV